MLTGDNEATAREIARKAGIAHYQASVLPQDKAAFVSRLQAEEMCIRDRNMLLSHGLMAMLRASGVVTAATLLIGTILP